MMDLPLPPAKKVNIQTWGCQMNVADSERMMALLKKENYTVTEFAQEADLIILNTCHIREKAKHKVVSRLGELAPLKAKNPGLTLAVSGCVAQAESKSLSKEVPFLDLVFGPDQIETLPQLLGQISSKRLKEGMDFQHSSAAVVDAKFNKLPYSIPIDQVEPWVRDAKDQVSRYVNIIKGCNNFCTFCVVPHTRGREKSRPLGEILEEVQFQVERGAKEITLLGQNVNSYGLDLLEINQNQEKYSIPSHLPFAELLYEVAKVPGLQRIRFTTSNPHDFTPSLAQAFADLPSLANSFHLPVQAGSNRILERMNRQYTREMYLERVGWIRKVRPNLAFSTDIIVGFPGETEQEFEETMELVKQMQYAFIFAFKYSPRPNTAALRFKDQIPEEEKDRRLQALLALQRDETLRQNELEVGTLRDVLLQYPNSKEVGTCYGRTQEGRLVKVYADSTWVGQSVPVKITGANLTALEGRIQ